ncbi:MAG: 1-(5-phosphoribosyl)-5-((5-phosphoribosylamino)methylideneamino)imidazole-4-carboxamide isomerase [Armatimonadetes bacterium]|nr:1-(5-phosphoribosyl)-5-((5-phosphoribosylamino)methylideneamino)imidazole-4-carboxamide isomerase [Armatimonadota bacterium]
MTVYPAIDLLAGRAVRLQQGDPARQIVVADDPVGLARRWEAEGARWLHLVDLDGAFTGRPCHLDLVGRICGGVGIPVQIGGGLRTMADLDLAFEAGAARAVLGTAALGASDLVAAAPVGGLLAEALARFTDRIVVALDARDGVVVTEGWQHASGASVVETARRLAAAGVSRFVYTDVASDGMLAGPNMSGLSAVMAASRVPVVLSGGISTLDHLRATAAAGAEGAIVGRAFYDGRFTLAEAVVAAVGAG